MNNMLNPKESPFHPESQRNTGVFGRVRKIWENATRSIRTVIGGKGSKEIPAELPPWTCSMRTRNGHARVTLEHRPGTDRITIKCEPSRIYVSKVILLKPDEVTRIIAATESMDSDALSALAGELAYTDMDDSRIEDPNGAGVYMKDALLKLKAPSEEEV